MKGKWASRVVVCVMLLGILSLAAADADVGYGAHEPDASERTHGLSVRASRVLYEAQRLIDGGEYEKAIRILEKFIEKHPKQDHCYVEFTLANALYFTDKKEACLARYQVAVELDPGFGPAWVNLGQVAYDLKHYGLAARALVKGFNHAEEEEKNPDLLYYAAVAHMMEGNKQKAAPILESLISGKHGDPDKEWFRALFALYLDLDREAKAARLLRQMMVRYGHEPETWRLSYQFEARRGDYEKAAVALTIYSYLKPLTREETILLGDLYAAIKVPVLASAYYENAFASGASPEEYERLASAYMAAHRTDEARKTLAEAVKHQPSATLWSLAGDLHYMEQDFEEAYLAFGESARLDPRDGRAYLMMGYCALQVNKMKQAAAALQKAAGFPKQRKLAKQLLKHAE